MQAEVVEDEQGDDDDGFESSGTGAIGAASGDPAEEWRGTPEEHVMATTDSLMPDGLGEMTFPHTGRSHEEDVLMICHEITRGDFTHRWFMDFGIEAEVEGFQRFLGGESRFDKPVRELLRVSSFDFILQESFEEVGEGPFFLDCLIEPELQAVHHAGEFESGEFGFEQGEVSHGAPPCSRPPVGRSGRRGVVHRRGAGRG